MRNMDDLNPNGLPRLLRAALAMEWRAALAFAPVMALLVWATCALR